MGLPLAFVVATAVTSTSLWLWPDRGKYIAEGWAVVAVNGTTLTLAVEGFDCGGDPRPMARVTENAHIVTISVRQLSRPNQTCYLDKPVYPITVRLRRALGTRALRGCDVQMPTTDCAALPRAQL